MANWISSKLRAAETILQQIDQQAAESLRKNEKPVADDDLKLGAPAKTSGSVPLKDQLKKKTLENSDYSGKLRSDPSFSSVNSSNYSSSGNENSSSNNKDKEIVGKPKSQPLSDSDWTQLLSAPKPAAATSTLSRGNGLHGVRGLRKDGRRQGSAASASNLEVKKNQKSGIANNVMKSVQRAGVGEGRKLNGRVSDGEESGIPDSARRFSTGELKSDGKVMEGGELDYRDVAVDTSVEIKGKANEEKGGSLDTKELSLEGCLESVKKNEGLSDKKIGGQSMNDQLRSSTVRGKHESSEAARSSTSEDFKRGFTSVTDGSSESDSDSGSSSDSESEREKEERRKQRQKILAEKAAAKAVEAIKEKENTVARLEGEKQSLEKILEVQVKQQAQEASKLQTTMMETMEAADIEKQKHNSTRMEAFVRLAKLETANADLAKSLATVQWNLEQEVNHVAELRQQVELKEVSHEELRRKISDTHQIEISLKKVAAPKGLELEQEILEAEYAIITDKVTRLQEKAKKLEADIEMTRKDIEDPTDIEIELQRRLSQMTDHLIQKQAQVEALSSEKATLQFRIEAVSRLLDEGKSMTEFSATSSRDIESGRPLFEDRIRSGREHLGSLLQQLDSIFMAGAKFLRRNTTARLWSLVYFICLHFWVIYILMSHSQPSNEIKSGAVISLENINNTSGV
ncbi:putative Golgin subfamily A member 5 protein [Rosa chinensis]|uniref:Putative Golgin subfamily A member 5 protein n=1 Tax=Rosa chinensis TaxID=74649 RepID=A0A2P6P1V1_ROSCH|nr:golgin candidate 2 [Rosa chinensis]PRQ15913.1 putative Golgin subfamily A member 5 protein [Rosa chinensis]